MNKCLQRANLKRERLGKGSTQTKGQVSWLSWPPARRRESITLVISEHSLHGISAAPDLWVTCYDLGHHSPSKAHFLHAKRKGLGQVIASSFNIL